MFFLSSELRVAQDFAQILFIILLEIFYLFSSKIIEGWALVLYCTEMLEIFITVSSNFFFIAHYFLLNGVHFQILRAIYRVLSIVTYYCGQ